MKILVACEESQRVCSELRGLGHEAYSCDIIDTSGNHPEWHIKADVTPILNGRCIFYTQDGVEHQIEDRWDMIIAFPPCTYLTITGNRWFNEERYGQKAVKRKEEREKAAEFFMLFVNADCDKIAIENPIGYMSTYYKKPTQIIQPYFFGEPVQKSTCLWLKGLNCLYKTNEVVPITVKYKNGKTDSPWHMDTMHLSPAERAKVRSKTYAGVAKAMG